MSKSSTSIFKQSVPAGWAQSALLVVVLFCTSLASALAQGCPPLSTLPCDQLQVTLPYSLSFSGSVAGTVTDKNGAGTGFTMVDAYSGTRLSADGTPTNTSVPGYEPSKLTVASGRLQVGTNKGIAWLGNNNQLNTLGVKVDSRSRLTLEVTLVNPYYGTSAQQGGLWFGLSDKMYVKLVVVGDKVELRREVNDASPSSDQRITGSISGINTSTVKLRLVADPATNTAEGFYSLNGGAEQSVGAALSISGMGLTASTAYAGIYATHRNASSSVTYTFDDFSVSGVTSTGNNPPVFTANNYNYNVSDNVNTGTGVGTVTASDPEGSAVTYTISAGNTNGAFAINSSTGAISVSKKLNYHTQEKYALTVRATDTGGQFGQTTVNITVTLGATASSFNSISWGTAASYPHSANELQGVTINNKIYAFGGYFVNPSTGNWTPREQAYVYDPSSNKWTSLAPMPAMNGTNYGGVTHAGFATDGTDVYFAGGYTSNATGTGQTFGTKEAWKYIVAENRYTRLPDLPKVISSGQLEYVNGKLHHIGGHNQSRSTDLGDHYVLDLDDLAAGWKTLAALPNPSNHAASCTYEGKIYYVGGQKNYDHNSLTLKDLYIYNPGTNSWTKGADMPVPSGATGRSHISSSIFVMGNRIFVLGGDITHGTNTNLVSAYSPAANSWESLTTLPIKVRGGVAAALGGHLYYTAGSNSSATTYKGTPGGATSTQQAVESFTLYNADTKDAIQPLTSGTTLNLSTLPTKNFNIRSNTNPATVGSVVFQLSGTESKTVNENRAPYDLMGDDGAWSPAVGSYTLKATPYSTSNGGGTAGTALTVTFSVTNETTTTSSNLINAGGNQYVDGQAKTWSADSYFSGGLTKSRSFNVEGTTDDPLYLHYRYANSGALFSYNIPVSGTGPYTVYLHFLEPYFGAPGGKSSGAAGARVFHVDIEGQRVLSDYDIYSQDGAGKAVVKMFHDVSVTDGILQIAFTSVKDNAIISAIEVASNALHMESTQAMTMEVYPNPITGDKMQVELEGFHEHEAVNITLYDLAGRAIQTTRVNTNQLGASKSEINISRRLHRGMYIIRAQAAKREVRTKLLLED